jgi:hypothetical protein
VGLNSSVLPFHPLSRGAPPYPPGCPATGTQAHDRSRELWFGRPAPVGATPVADQPIEPLRGELQVVTSAVAESDKFKPGLDPSCEFIQAFMTHQREQRQKLCFLRFLL